LTNGNASEFEMIHPSAKKHGADAHVPAKSKQQRPKDLEEQKLVQGLERSMAGSDPVSVSQLVSQTPMSTRAIDNATRVSDPR
jgi:hypothetical protein